MPFGVSEVELLRRFKGGGRCRDRADEDRLVGLGEVSPAWTKFEEEALGSPDAQDWTGHGRIVCAPRLDGRGDISTGCLSQRGQGKAIKDHGHWAPLGNPFARENDGAITAAPPKKELGRVPVAVETEPGTVGPSMPNSPEHGFSTKLVEAVGDIDEEHCGGLGGREAGVLRNGRKDFLHRHVRKGAGGGGAGTSGAAGGSSASYAGGWVSGGAGG